MRYDTNRERLAELLASNEPTERMQANSLLNEAGKDAADWLAAIADREKERWEFRQFFLHRLYGLPFLLFALMIAGHFGRSLGVNTGVVFMLLLGSPWLPFIDRQIGERFNKFNRLRAVVLELAQRDDERALLHLARVWNIEAKEVPGNARVESEFERLLGLYTFPNNKLPVAVREKIVRLYRGKKGRKTPRWEFSNTRADLVVTLLRHLAVSPEAKDREVVAWIAQSQAQTTNHVLVRDAAQVFLQAGENALQAKATLPAPARTEVNSTSFVSVGQGGGKP